MNRSARRGQHAGHAAAGLLLWLACEGCEIEEAEQLNDLAAEKTNSAAEAGSTANDYTISVVLLAAALFFAGISTKFSSNRARIMLLAAGGVAFLVVVTWIAILPKSVAL